MNIRTYKKRCFQHTINRKINRCIVSSPRLLKRETGRSTVRVTQPEPAALHCKSSAHARDRVARTGFAYPDQSPFRQIRNCSRQIGVVDQLETAIAAALTGCGVRSVFWISDEKISRRILSGDQGMIVWWSGAGVHVEPHSHANEQIVSMLKGKMEFRFGSEQRLCRQGDRHRHFGRYGARGM